MSDRLIVSICGAAGAGKSQLAKNLVAVLGDEHCVRVPTDYFLQPAQVPLAEYVRQAVAYDWDALARALAAPIGTRVATPAFDFVTFRRSATAHAPTFSIRPILVIDAMYPYPKADLSVLLEVPAATRRLRIGERDRVWGTQVAARWEQLVASEERLAVLPATFDLRLDGEQPLAVNARRIGEVIRARLDRWAGTARR